MSIIIFTHLPVIAWTRLKNETCNILWVLDSEKHRIPIGSNINKLCIHEHDPSIRLKPVWFSIFDLPFSQFLFVIWLEVLNESCSSWYFLQETPTFICHLYLGCNLEAFWAENLWFPTLNQIFALFHHFHSFT